MIEISPIKPELERVGAVDIAEKQESNEIKEKKETWRLKDFNGFIHFHSWEGSSCGREMIENIAKALKNKTGLKFISFNEHVGWPGEEYWSEKIKAEFANIDEIQKQYPDLKIFKGIEVNVMKDGTIDGRDLLEESDIVVASHHYKNIEKQEDSTAEATKERWLKVMDNFPEVGVLGHPLRDLPESEWPKMDWDTICQKANEKNVIIEVGISDSAVDHLPEDFLEALVRNNNKVVFAPDFHHLANPDMDINKPHFLKRDNWLGHRIEDLSEAQRAILKRYYELKGNISGKSFKEKNEEVGDYVLKGRKPEFLKHEEVPLTEAEYADVLAQLKSEKEELQRIENSNELREIHDILFATEKVNLPNGKTKERFPLLVATLMRFGRRMARVRRLGLKKENLVNTWSKEEMENWVNVKKNLIKARKNLETK
jgi:histidinol phosphatase-like PHP family hydrolase